MPGGILISDRCFHPKLLHVSNTFLPEHTALHRWKLSERELYSIPLCQLQWLSEIRYVSTP